MEGISPLNIKNLFKIHYKSKEPFHLVGEPSTAKSQLIKQGAKEQAEEENREFIDWSRITHNKKEEIIQDPSKYFIFEDLRASETDVGELRLQEMNSNKDYITYKYNIVFKALSDPNAKGVIFFDEMNLAPNLIKAQFYKLYNDRAIGDLPISDDVLIISAGNESSQVRDVTQDPVPLVTRRANYHIRPLTYDEFINYAFETEMHQAVTGYIMFSPSDVHGLDYESEETMGQPCVRTWEKLSNVLKSNKDIDEKTVYTLATGFVGPATATKFHSYYKANISISLDKIINDPETVRNINDIQMIYNIVTGLISRFKENDKIFPVICKVAVNIKEEIAVYTLRKLKDLNQSKFKKLATEKYASEFSECSNKFGNLLIEED